MSSFSYNLKLHTMRLWLSSFVVVVPFTFSKSHLENEVVTKKEERLESKWNKFDNDAETIKKTWEHNQISTMIEKEYTTKFWSHFSLHPLRDYVDNEV